MTIEELFNEFRHAFAFMINDEYCFGTWFDPEDRCGDDSQPLMDFGHVAFEPSDVESIENLGYLIQVNLKSYPEPFLVQALYSKNFFESPNSIFI